MNFAASGFFALRTPLLPFDEFLAWNDGLKAPAALSDPARCEQALAEDRQQLRTRLREIAGRPEVREALFVASPAFEESLEIWAREPDSERGQGIELALVRYFARMAGRPTPFGLCAGCSVGTIGVQSRLVVENRALYQRHARLDMGYLDALCEALACDPEVRRALTYRRNSSLYRIAGCVRYFESRSEEDPSRPAEKTRSFHLVSVEETECLIATLARAEAGASFASLAEALVDEEITLADAEGYIGELIDNQILIPSLAPCVTGAEPARSIAEKLEQLPAALPAAKALRQVRAELTAMNAAALGQPTDRYRTTARLLEGLAAKVDLPRLFQVDMIKPAPAATLGGAVLNEIMRGVEVLHRLTPSSDDAAADDLTRFRDAFVARYEAREVALIEALDAENGIGFPISTRAEADGSPLLRGLQFPAASDESVRWGTRENLLLRKLSEALESGAREIVLQPGDIERMAAKEPSPLPDTFAASVTVAAASEAALANGDFRVIVSGISSPGARFLGRFCHADEALHRHVLDHLRAEEALRPEAVFAEIVHLPEGRLGNILARPILRDHEIPLLGQSGVAAEYQIPLADLHVSVREKRIVLRSARLGREIIPRLTSAHNFTWGGMGSYQFLCMLQSQGTARELGWSWGALDRAPFLPRVTFGRLVLDRARWRVEKDELKQLAGQRGSERFRAVQAWRKRRRLPRLIALAEADHTLPIDLDNVLSVETFIHLSKSRDEVSLVELFPAPDQLCAHGSEGRFVHELIVPFVRKPDADEKRPAAKSKRSSLAVPRTFPPGSEWLYAKLYTGSATADQVLREVVGPLVAEIIGSGAADQWFFIRYGDPDWHVRLRFHGELARLHAEVVPAIETAAAQLLAEGRLRRVQFDTYEREVERYGGAEGVVLAERIFQADSEAVLEILGLLEAGDAGLSERWQLTLRGIDMLLNDFAFNLEARRALMRKVRESFVREHRADAELKAKIGEKFREERRNLERLLDGAQDAESELSPGFEILRRRSARLVPMMAELRACDAAGRLTMPLGDIALSCVHMHANRLLRSAHRAQEMVLYDFLARLYDSQCAQGRFQSNKLL